MHTDSSTDREEVLHDDTSANEMHSESPEPPLKRKEEEQIRRLRISLFNKRKVVKFDTLFFSYKS